MPLIRKLSEKSMRSRGRIEEGDMSKIRITAACGNYDRTRALIDGTVQIEGVDLNYLQLRPSELFWRMLNNEEFDLSELSFSTYTIMRSEGDDRFIALPVFPSRTFRHSCLYIRSNAGIQAPEDLKGKTIGVGDYQMTAAVWVRGFLQHEYQVRPENMKWIVGQPVRELRRPAGVDMKSMRQGESLDELLERGEIDALISVVLPPSFVNHSPHVRRMFPDYREVETDYYRRTRIFPIMHTLVLRSKIYEANPWLAISIYKAFVQAKELGYRRLYDTDALTVGLPWLVDEIEKLRSLFGDDIWNYSVKGSLPTLEAFLQYMSEQGLTKGKMRIDDLFVRNIREELSFYLDSIGEKL